MDDRAVTSNTESGDGYCDIMIEIEDSMTGILIEVKYAENDRLEEQRANALHQIEQKYYEQFLIDEGYTTILKYGIACYKKDAELFLHKLSLSQINASAHAAGTLRISICRLFCTFAFSLYVPAWCPDFLNKERRIS